jgi:hypothetical protein
MIGLAWVLPAAVTYLCCVRACAQVPLAAGNEQLRMIKPAAKLNVSVHCCAARRAPAYWECVL